MVLLIALAGCSNAPQGTRLPVNLHAAPVRPALPAPAPIQTRPVDFTIITPDHLPEGSDWVVFGMDATSYENLAFNNAETLRWAMETGFQLRYYRGEVQ